MKLTADNIQFIDSYLKNSGVKYIDIRMEMTDHIASALEGMDGGFYENFKAYMAGHKGQFLNTNRKFTNAATVSALRMIAREMLGPWFLVPVTVMFGSLWFVKIPREEAMYIAEGVYSIFFAAILLYFVYIRVFKKSMFSVADKVVLAGLIVVYVTNRLFLYRIIDNDYKLAAFVFLASFIIAVFSAFYKIISKYKLQYHG